ncbi:hypothetical protein ACWEOE_31580 [Amycolatopsis sp. NPDC004368]
MSDQEQFELAGLPHSRCNFARVRVNGALVGQGGTFVNAEPIMPRYIGRNLGNLKGNLRPRWSTSTSSSGSASSSASPRPPPTSARASRAPPARTCVKTSPTNACTPPPNPCPPPRPGFEVTHRPRTAAVEDSDLWCFGPLGAGTSLTSKVTGRALHASATTTAGGSPRAHQDPVASKLYFT